MAGIIQLTQNDCGSAWLGTRVFPYVFYDFHRNAIGNDSKTNRNSKKKLRKMFKKSGKSCQETMKNDGNSKMNKKKRKKMKQTKT